MGKGEGAQCYRSKGPDLFSTITHFRLHDQSGMFGQRTSWKRPLSPFPSAHMQKDRKRLALKKNLKSVTVCLVFCSHVGQLLQACGNPTCDKAFPVVKSNLILALAMSGAKGSVSEAFTLARTMRLFSALWTQGSTCFRAVATNHKRRELHKTTCVYTAAWIDKICTFCARRLEDHSH